MRMMRSIGAAAAMAVLVFLPGVSPAWGDEPQSLARQIVGESKLAGGVVVHVGFSDARFTAALRAGPSFVVHGLASDPQVVERARKLLLAEGTYGQVSFDCFEGGRLPYVNNLVNLLVVQGGARPPVAEIYRVLTPRGMAWIELGQTCEVGQHEEGAGNSSARPEALRAELQRLGAEQISKRDGWLVFRKPWPNEMDEWTHYLYGPHNNAVSHDTIVGPPKHLQWVGGPRWARHHEHLSSVNAMVSAGGKLFYVIDEGARSSIQLPPHWKLVARDAFNGTVLWKRNLPRWYAHTYPLKSGPADLPRRLAAVGDRVYCPLGIDQPLSVLDANTGRILRTFAGGSITGPFTSAPGTARNATCWPSTSDRARCSGSAK